MACAADETDSDAREGAGPDRRRDAVERAEAALGRPDQALDERQQRFRVAALHGDRFGSERFGGVEIEDTAGNRGKGRVEGKNSHEREYDKFGGQTKAAGNARAPQSNAASARNIAPAPRSPRR